MPTQSVRVPFPQLGKYRKRALSGRLRRVLRGLGIGVGSPRIGIYRQRQELCHELAEIDRVAGHGFWRFAVVGTDHEIAQVYVRDGERLDEAASCLAALPGVGQVLDRDAQFEMGCGHANGGGGSGRKRAGPRSED